MPSTQAPEAHNQHRRKWWFIAFGTFLGLLSLFWSVDRTLVYFFLGGAAFSLFKVLYFSREKTNAFSAQGYENYNPPQTRTFWEDLKTIFREKTSESQTPQPVKVIIALVLAFVGFAFFSSILAALFGDDTSDGYTSDQYQKASDFYANQQYDSAAYYYGLALQDDPENPELYFERGNAFLNANNADSALLMYDQTLIVEPQHEQAQYNKASIYYNRKNYRQAIDETKKIMEYDPDYLNGMLLIGDCFYNQSQLDSALRWYEGAYVNGYRSAILSHLMAYIYDVKGQTNKAIELYQEAIGQDSTIVDIYTRLGELVPGEEGNWYRQKAAQLRQQ